MEWLLGAVVGGVVGFASALVTTEYRAWRDQDPRKKDFARVLQSEISLGKEALEKGVQEGQLKRPARAAFTRDVYRGCIADLALLPEHTRYAVQNVYTCLDGV